MVSSAPSNLTHPKAPFLPDAPDAFAIARDTDASPYHESTTSLDEHYKVLWAIHTMAIVCVRDIRLAVGGELDFSPGSLKHLDAFVDSYDIEKRNEEDAVVFVAEVGSYFGVVLQMEHGGEWHTSPKYYFSALRFSTRTRGLIETNPFAAVVKRAYGRQDEAPISMKYSFLSKTITG